MIPFADLSEVWGAAMWRASWQGGMAALVVWSVCRCMPSMPARFQAWLWRLVLLKFVVVLLWSAPIAVPLLPAPEPTRWESTEPVPSIQTEAVLSVAEHQAPGYITPLLIGLVLWTVVVGSQAVRILNDYRAVRRLRTESRLCENRELRDQLATASQSAGLRTPPALFVSEGDGSPMLIGVLFPAIVLPAATLSRLSDGERSMVIGHELAHARRGDLLWSLIAAVVRIVFFFHPLAWLSERQLSLTQEIAADELSIVLQEKDAFSYATLLVSILGKLGPQRPLSTMSVGAVGSISSLKRRLTAMRFMKPVSRRIVVAYGVVMGLAAGLGVVPWTLVAAQAQTAPTPDKNAKAEKAPEKGNAGTKDAAGQKPKVVSGRLVSFKDGTVTLQTNTGATIGTKVADSAKTMLWSNVDDKYVPAATVETLTQTKPGTLVVVRTENETVTLRVGARKGKTVGTFVSFKNDRLLILGKDLGESFVKKYGNNVHFNKFREDVPVYESIDGGPYQLVAGPTSKALANIREGVVVTVHAEGDDNITLVQIGVPKKN